MAAGSLRRSARDRARRRDAGSVSRRARASEAARDQGEGCRRHLVAMSPIDRRLPRQGRF